MNFPKTYVEDAYRKAGEALERITEKVEKQREATMPFRFILDRAIENYSPVENDGREWIGASIRDRVESRDAMVLNYDEKDACVTLVYSDNQEKRKIPMFGRGAFYGTERYFAR